MLSLTPTLAFVLLAIGLLMLALELFLPTGGVFFALSVLAIVTGVTVAFLCDQTTGWYSLIGTFVALPLVVGLGFYFWPKTPIGKRLILRGPAEDSTVASMPVNLELEQLRGRFGRTLGPLRPSGVVDFDGRRIDTITEGMMVDAGCWVKCIDVKAGRVVVRPVDQPDLGGLESADFTT